VVIAIIALLAAMLLPALARAKDKAQALRCMSNNKQLVLGALLYADDWQGSLPPNGDPDGNGYFWIGGNLRDPSDSGTWNVAFLANANNKLAPYVGANIDLYRCPADKTTAIGPGNRVYPRIRSYSMNCAVGTCGGADDWGGDHELPNGGPSLGLWLNGPWQFGQPFPSETWNTYGRIHSVAAPGPANVWVFIDEDEYSIATACFYVCMLKPTSLVSWPGTRHGSTASFSFLDGHAEVHHWRDGRTKNTTHQPGPINMEGSGVGGTAVPEENSPDIEWLQSHTSSHK
jgi:prepilin-type processing-associated H-X9-DG protein